MVSYQEALDVLQASLPYVIQKKDRHTGEWYSVGQVVRGQQAAYDESEAMRIAGGKRDRYRVLPKNEADKYREGLAFGRSLRHERGDSEDVDDGERPKGHRPLMVMPDHL